MKNFKFTIFFGIIFIFLAINLANKKDIFNFDIFELVNFENKHKIEYKKLQKKINKQSFFLFKNKKDLEKFIEFSKKLEIFEQIFYKNEFDLQKISDNLNSYKLALLDYKHAQILINNEEKFFDEIIKKYFNPTNLKLKYDPLFLLSNSSSLNQKSEILLDENLYFTMMIKGEKYYFVNAILSKNLKNLNKIIDFCDNLNAIYAGSEILSTIGRNQGLKESFVFGSIVIVIIFIFLSFAFGNFYVLSLILPVIFGLVVGLFFVILFFGQISILTFIISSSLTGLMMDFSMHFLGENYSKKIEKKSIKKLKNMFLLGFFITSTGYMMFLFADFIFLKQIAVFSIFGLLATMTFSYFALPEILNNKIFIQKKIFTKFLQNLEKFSNKFAITNKKFIIFSFIFICLTIFEFFYLKSEENLKDYYQNSPKISKNLEILDQNLTTILLPKNINANKILSDLKNENLFSDFSVNFILNSEIQKILIQKFEILKNDEKILDKFKNIGLNEKNFQKEFENLSKFNVKNPSEFCKILDKFCLDENYFLGYLKNVKNSKILEQKLVKQGIILIDFKSKIEKKFNELKEISIYLKIAGFMFAFLFLWLFFDAVLAVKILFLIIFSVVLTLFVFTIFGITLNIFGVFGLILASAVGIDYMIFAKNYKMTQNGRIFGIFAASFTTIISFFMLSFSNVNAVRNFGLTISLTIFFISFFAFLLVKEKRQNYLKSC